jgi:ribosomal protein S27AE
MSPGENEKIETNIPESCPKCGKGVFYRMSPDEKWRCYFCDPPPIVRRMQERLGNDL